MVPVLFSHIKYILSLLQKADLGDRTV